MDAAMRALTKEQIMDAGLTKKVALEHDTVMIEQPKDGGRGNKLECLLLAQSGHIVCCPAHVRF